TVASQATLTRTNYQFAGWNTKADGSGTSYAAGAMDTIGPANDTLFAKWAALSDADGNVYTTVTIGAQTWMVQNLKTTTYNDGTSIPLVTDSIAWFNLSTPGYCWYNNDVANKATYGALYNWYTVNTGKLAPAGWHVPTDSEWTVLFTYLGSDTLGNAGGKLKEAGTLHWLSPNTNATNESGFSALPGGFRVPLSSYSIFNNMSTDGVWWSSTRYISDPSMSDDIDLRSSSGYIYPGYALPITGNSVRLIRN
ncbi:MAG: FISUMP domain-containing protein, partial [Chitinivibrionales bacterium]